MGRTRKFTTELYDTMLGYVDSSSLEWLWTYIGWEIQDAFLDVDLTDETDGYQKYLQGIVEVNDYTGEKLHTIFCNVKSIDDNYGALLEQVNDEITDYTTIIRRMRETIGDVNFADNFTPASFLTSVAKEAKTMTMVRWREVLKKSADEITAEEYALLAGYLVQNGDVALLEEMLVACYDYKEVNAYQNGGGLETTRVIYESPEKLKNLAAAMEELQRVWTAAQYLGYTGEDQSDVFRAVQYTSLLRKLSEYPELSVLSQKNTMTGVERVLLKDLIEVTYDAKTGDVQASFCPYNAAYSGSHCDYALEKNQKVQCTVSYPAIGSSAWAKVQAESHTYINAYIGPNERAPEAMSKEVAGQFLGIVTGMIPGADKVTAVADVVNAGVSAEIAAHDTTVQESMELTDLGLMFDTFQLVYVGTDTNGEIKDHEFSLYQSTETANWIEAFNRYMQSEEGNDAANLINYAGLPGGEMTFEYVAENPGEVARMVELLNKNSEYNTKFYCGIGENYKEISSESEQKNEKY